MGPMGPPGEPVSFLSWWFAFHLEIFIAEIFWKVCVADLGWDLGKIKCGSRLHVQPSELYHGRNYWATWVFSSSCSYSPLLFLHSWRVFLWGRDCNSPWSSFPLFPNLIYRKWTTYQASRSKSKLLLRLFLWVAALSIAMEAHYHLSVIIIINEISQIHFVTLFLF